MNTKLDSERFNKAAQKTVSDELEVLEKRILSDLAEMVTEAHTRLKESGVFAKFKTFLNGRKPNNSDVLHFKRMIENVVNKNDAMFRQYFDVVTERDPANSAIIGFEFRIKRDAFR